MPMHPLDEIDRAEGRLLKAIDRVVDLIFRQDPLYTEIGAARLARIRYRVANAAMAAFRRAETPPQRDRLIHIIDEMRPVDDPRFGDFLDRVAREDPDEEVAEYAAEARDNFRRHEALDIEGW